MPLREERVSQPGRELQCSPVLACGLDQHVLPAVRGCADHVNFLRVAQSALGEFRLLQGSLRFMQFEIRIREPEMRLPVVGLSLQCRFEVIRSLTRLVKVVQHVTAIHIGCDHFGVACKRLGKVLPRLLAESLVLVNVALKQRNIRLLRENVEIVRRQT